MKLDIAAIKAQARLREDSVELCLRGDLYNKQQRLQRDLQRAMNANTDSINSMTIKAKAIADELAQVEADMMDATLTLNFRALHANDYDALAEAYPADDEGSIPAEFWYQVIAACLFDPEKPVGEDQPVWEVDKVRDLIESGTFSSAQLLEIQGCVLGVNQDADIPF